MATMTDDELETSTSTLMDESAQPALDDAAESEVSNEAATPSGGEDSGKQPASTTARGSKQSGASNEEESSVDKALDFLSGKEKRDRTKDEKVTADAVAKAKEAQAEKVKVTAKQPEAKKPDQKPSDDALTAEDLKLPEYNRKRIGKLLEDRKTFRADAEKVRSEYEAAKPLMEQGKAFADVVQEFALSKDIGVLEDEDVAGAVIFQACLRRLEKGNGTDEDRKTAASMFGNLDSARAALGLAPAAPSVDLEAMSNALDKAEQELDFDDLRKLVAEMKSPAKQASAPAPQPKQQAQPVQQQQPERRTEPVATDPSAAPDYRLYQQRAVNRLTADGVKDPVTYFEKQVFPRILTEIKAAYSSENPTGVWQKLSPQAKHDLSISAHENIQKQAKRLAPTPAKPTPNNRPLSGGGNAPAWAKSTSATTNAAAAIAHLSGD